MENTREKQNLSPEACSGVKSCSGSQKQELLVVSFGTGDDSGCLRTLGGIEYALETAFPEWSVHCAFTGGETVRRNDMDTVSQAMERAVKSGVTALIVQPTHMTFGLDYHDLIHQLAEHYTEYDRITLGQPLLTSEEDFSCVASVMLQATEAHHRQDTAVCVIGQDTEYAVRDTYAARMQRALRGMGDESYFVGTVGDADGVLRQVRKHPYRRVVLVPLAIVVEEYVEHAIDGDQEGSWRQVFESAGYEVQCLLRGLGDMEPIRQIYVRHTREAMRQLYEEAV